MQMHIKKEKCKECAMEVQSFNITNHAMNHELEKKAALAAAQKTSTQGK